METARKPRMRIALPMESITAICLKYTVEELAVFGSVLTDDFRPDSDVDFLVSFLPDADLGPWMTRFFQMEEELSNLIGRKVDLVERRGIEQSRNPIVRRSILDQAEVIYGP